MTNIYSSLKRVGLHFAHPDGEDLAESVEQHLETLRKFSERVGFADGVLHYEEGPLREQEVYGSDLFEPFEVKLAGIAELLTDVADGLGPHPQALQHLMDALRDELLGQYTRGFNRGVAHARRALA